MLPPTTEDELMEKTRTIAGLSLAQLAERLGRVVPADLRHNKGWTGQLIEEALGASAGSQAEPDFQAIGVELKTLPVGMDGLPRESTHVCTVPLTNNTGITWENSWIRRKLLQVLWVPVEGEREIPLADRRVGTSLLWRLEPDMEAILRTDWEELMEMVCLGELENISARLGTYLQIRPKAANSRSLRQGVGKDGEPILTNPRGFYLRTTFTREILRRYYALPIPGNPIR